MKQGTIKIENLSGGWISDFKKGSNSSYQTRANTYYSGLFNPNNPNYIGQISNAITEGAQYGVGYLPINATKAGDKGYFILSNGYITEGNIVAAFPTGFGTNYTEPAGCLDDKYKDIWTHVTTTGQEAIMFTYQTNTNAYVGIAPTSSIASRNNTYFTLTYRNVPHVGVVSAANQSYITDGNYVQAYNPNAASPFATRINVGTGWTTVSVADYGNYVAIVGNNGNSSRMWLWNGTSQDPNFQYDIRDTTVHAIVNEGGELRVFTSGKNGTTKIKTFSGNGFSEEADWETPTSICSAPTHAMVDVYMNQIVWRTTDGYIWTYGSPRKNEVLSGAHRIGRVTTSNTEGCVKNLYTNNLYIGASNSGFQIYNLQSGVDYVLASQIKTALYQLPHYSSINMIRVYFSNFRTFINGASSSFHASLYDGYGTTDLLDYTIPNNLSDAYITYHPIKVSIANLDSFYLNIDFSGCIIKKIEVDYSVDERNI